MIDYLERLFFPDKKEREGEREDPAPFPPGEETPRPLVVYVPGEGELPQAMPAAKLQTEEVETLTEAAFRTEEVQPLRGTFPEEEAPAEMVETSVEEEEVPKSLPLTRQEQEEILPLTAVAFRDTEDEAAVKRQRLRLYPEEGRTSRPVLTGEEGQELPRVSFAWKEPDSEAYLSRFAQRYRDGEREEDLEHRLRRNSRRYDSGFFLY